MTSKVLVVGAGGYIGEGVAKAFRRSGYQVYGVIRNADKKSYLLQNEIIPVIGDLDKPSEFEAQIKECAIIIDAVGSVGGPSQKFFDYVKQLKANPIHNYKTLFIFTSGIMINYAGYFDENLRPKSESDPVNPVDPEEMIPKKQLEEKILQTTELRTVVVRPGFLYGGHGGVILPWFFGINPEEKQLVLSGRPDKRWSWVHVDDLGEAYVKVAKAGRVVDNEIFHVSDQDCPTYEELKVACARAAGWKGTKQDTVVVPLADHEHRQKSWESNVIISSQKAKDVLGWYPSHAGVVNEVDIYYAAYKASKGK